MKDKITEIIEFGSESFFVDFKKEQYPIEKHIKKHELLKDISAMANHPSDADKFILIGIKEKNGLASEFFNIDSVVDEAKYQQLIDSSIEPQINFEYLPIQYNNNNLAYFRIFSNNDRPYLFKKDIRNFQNNDHNEFREGEGYIRIGTSTKKINRKILDQIYTAKMNKSDRKSDIKIIAYIRKSTDNLLHQFDSNFFDLDIENLSKKSIDFDIELKIFKSQDYKIISKVDFKNELEDKIRKKQNAKSPFSIALPSFTPRETNFHLQFEELDDYYLIRRNKMRTERTSFTIAQMDKERSVFFESIYVLGEYNKLRGEIIIRSDEFYEGVFIKDIEIT